MFMVPYTIKSVHIRYTALLLSCCLGFSSTPICAASTNASGTADIRIAMSLSTQSNMVFGDISTGSTAGRVVLTTDGVRSAVGGATVNSESTATPAEFSASGLPSAVFSISMPSSVILTDPANNTIVVDSFVSDPPDNGQLDASGKKTVLIGATLHVANKQALGAYTGLIMLNVDYD